MILLKDRKEVEYSEESDEWYGKECICPYCSSSFMDYKPKYCPQCGEKFRKKELLTNQD